MPTREVSARFFDDLWNRRAFEAAPAIVAETCITHQLRSAPEPMTAETRGPAALVAHIQQWLTSFPDLTAHVDAVVADRDRVVSWVRMIGTHRAPWQGIPATGKRVVIQCCVMHRIVSGLIAEDWVITESFGVFRQLGVVESLPVLLSGPAERNPPRSATCHLTNAAPVGRFEDLRMLRIRFLFDSPAGELGR